MQFWNPMAKIHKKTMRYDTVRKFFIQPKVRCLCRIWPDKALRFYLFFTHLTERPVRLWLS